LSKSTKDDLENESQTEKTKNSNRAPDPYLNI